MLDRARADGYHGCSMPRANRYLLPGYPCHLTHRCHDREWLLRFKPVREEYRRRLRASLRATGVSLLSYSITSNLWRCMRYADLNMVRAGAVKHPSEWRWCGYDELMGRRKRYRLLDMPRLLELTGCSDAGELSSNYSALLEETSRGERLEREAQWTEAIAVGSREFVEEIADKIEGRVRVEVDEAGEDTWTVREATPSYGATGGKSA